MSRDHSLAGRIACSPFNNAQSFLLQGTVWTAYIDPSSSVLYFFNRTSGAAQWADPRRGPSEAQMAQLHGPDRAQVCLPPWGASPGLERSKPPWLEPALSQMACY